jgi:hypothetical protein
MSNRGRVILPLTQFIKRERPQKSGYLTFRLAPQPAEGNALIFVSVASDGDFLTASNMMYLER